MASDHQTRSRRLRIIVTCAQRKTRPVPAELKLRTITTRRADTRLETWAQHLIDASEGAMPALELYAGEHWDIARRLASTDYPKGLRGELWVCSAGYGLIPAEARIVPYSATFSAGTPDSIPGGPKGASNWWASLARWAGPVTAARSLGELAASDPTARLLLVLSASYLTACRDDVMSAIANLEHPKLLSIISAGTKGHNELHQFLLPVDARLQYALGGSRQALNVRAADYIMSTGRYDHDDMSEGLAKLLATQPPLRYYDRRPATDDEVRKFIRQALCANARATHTGLLREFRSSQRACEQARFAALFQIERRSQS